MATSAINIKKNKYYENPKDFCIYTPPEITYWIYDLINDNKDTMAEFFGYNILDICCGKGNLSKPFNKKENKIIGIDIADVEFPYGEFIKADFIKKNDKQKLFLKDKKVPGFSKEEITKLKEFTPSLLLSNPPFNGCEGKKLYPWEITKRIVELFGPKMPLVMFTLMGFRLNRRYGASREKEFAELEKKGLKLTSIASMPIDAFFPGSKTKGQQWEILFFNLPQLDPHYWYTEEIRQKYLNKLKNSI